MKTTLIKILAILLIVLIICPMQILEVLAVSIGEDYYLERGKKGFYTVQKKDDKTDKWIYITYEIVYYKDKNGKEDKMQVAYCMDPTLPGVGWAKDSIEGYDVKLKEILSDSKIWRICINGYPYKTAKELEVDTDEDAYLATKEAINCILRNYKLEDIRQYFRAGQDEIEGQDMAETKARGEKVVNAIYNLVYKAYNSSQTPANPEVIDVNKIGNLKEEKDGYYSQEYSVISDINIEKYTIIEKNNFSNGTIITDINGKEKSEFNKSENFKVLIPKENMKTDTNGNVKIKVKCENYPIFYGESSKSGYQNYAVCSSPYGELIVDSNIYIKTNTAKIIINKTDGETQKPIEGVKFELSNDDRSIVLEGVTNNKGTLTFENLYCGKYNIKELETNQNYILDENNKEIELEYGKTYNMNITNKCKSGDLIVYKIDKDNNNIGLGNIEFELFSEEFNKVIGKFVTDENGEIKIPNLRIGKYKLRETKTNKWYNLEEEKEITINWNEITETTVENELKKGSINVIKVDKDNKEIKLSGVKFQVLDEKGNILETIVTNENGEAKTSEYPIRDYKKLIIKEIETKEEYNITEQTKTVILEENKITNVAFENEKKKGQVKVIKVDKDNNEIKLEGVLFQILDENGNIVETLKTDKNGEAISKKLPIDKTYTIKEIQTKQEYELNNETQTFKLKNNEITEMKIENEKKKGQIEIIKMDEENAEYKIPNVEFQVLDKNKKIVEKIITDENGIAKTCKLPIGEYYIKETKTDEMYILEDKEIKVLVEENKTSTIELTNKKIKGQIKIYKTSNDDNEILNKRAGSPIKDVEFEILDLDGNVVDKIKTDKDGIAITKLLEKGRYIIKETNPGEGYILNESDFLVKIEQNNEIVEIEIKNNSQVPKREKKLPRTGY